MPFYISKRLLWKASESPTEESAREVSINSHFHSLCYILWLMSVKIDDEADDDLWWLLTMTTVMIMSHAKILGKRGVTWILRTTRKCWNWRNNCLNVTARRIVSSVRKPCKASFISIVGAHEQRTTDSPGRQILLNKFRSAILVPALEQWY